MPTLCLCQHHSPDQSLQNKQTLGQFFEPLYIMHYLAGMQDYKIIYDGIVGDGLMAYTDSDWAADQIKRRSTTGYFATLAGGIICWQSRLQKTVALSSTEAEYMALSDTSRQIKWIQSIFSELGFALRGIPICADN